jgi:hypothetical protein
MPEEFIPQELLMKKIAYCAVSVQLFAQTSRFLLKKNNVRTDVR